MTELIGEILSLSCRLLSLHGIADWTGDKRGNDGKGGALCPFLVVG
jgi:hypothetical protein